MNEMLRKSLVELRLSGMAGAVEVRVQEANGNGLGHLEFLELIVEDEKIVRKQRLLTRRRKAASFRDIRTLEEFDWTFNPSVNRKQIFDLAAGHFIKEARDILLVGPPGVGKSHLAQALGYQVIKLGHTVLYKSIFDLIRDFLRDEAFGAEERVLTKYLKPDLLIVDDMGMKQLPKKSGEYLFEVIMRRHEVRSTIMTSNRPIEEWGKLLQDVPSATAILDRFLQHAELIPIKGRSYRLKGKKLAEDSLGE